MSENELRQNIEDLEKVLSDLGKRVYYNIGSDDMSEVLSLLASMRRVYNTEGAEEDIRSVMEEVESLRKSLSARMRRKLIIHNFQSPGDIVMLTAAVRDLNKAHGSKFDIDVRTSCGHLWENNPHITHIDDKDPDAEIVTLGYDLIHSSNTNAYHFIHGFRKQLEKHLGLVIPAGDFKGDIHISDKEKSWSSQIQDLTGKDTPFWIINAGGKTDYTCKWWDTSRYQQVVDALKDRVQFVQVGALEKNHNHEALSGVIDLRGKTDLRQLVRLVYHSSGIICPVTLLMHLAAAVEVRPGRCLQSRPCVVIAGGREPVQWEAYPNHAYLHTQGKLPCCDKGGCWKSRVVPLDDGDKSKNDSLCLVPVELKGGTVIPRCLDMISADDVVRHVNEYIDGLEMWGKIG